MKKVFYYSALIILWAIIHVLFGITMIAVGAIEGPFPSPLLALGVAVLIPEYWLISTGLTLFARGLMARMILGKEERHSKTLPTILVALGCIMVIANVLINVFQDDEEIYKPVQPLPQKEIVAYENNFESHQEGLNTGEKLLSDYDLLLAKTISDIKRDLKIEFENMEKRTPIVIDKYTTLSGIKSSGSTYTFIYRLDFEKEMFTEKEWKENIEEIGEEKKSELYNETISTCIMADVDSNDFFKAAGIKFKYIFNDKNNQYVGSYEIAYKDLAKE